MCYGCLPAEKVSALVARLRGELRPVTGEEQLFGGSAERDREGEGPVDTADRGDEAKARGGRSFQSARQDGGDCSRGSFPESFVQGGERNSQFGGGSNGSHDLSSRPDRCHAFAHDAEPRSDHHQGARYRNVGADLSAICESGSDAVEAEKRREKLGGRGDVDGLGSSSGNSSNSAEKEEEEEEEMRLLHMGDGGSSDDTADTADGATDHEDVHTEEDDSSSLPSSSHPHDEENDKASNSSSISSSSSTDSTGGASGGISSNNSSRSNMSSSNPSSDNEASGHGSAASDDHRGRGRGRGLTGGTAARMPPREKRNPAPVRHGAAAAASAGEEGVPPSAFRRRGWSSSKLVFSDLGADFVGRRRASEDLAVSAKGLSSLPTSSNIPWSFKAILS